MKNFTFKKEPEETGLRHIIFPQSGTNIKLNKKEVGFIHPPGRNQKSWSIRFMVKRTPDKNDPCPFKWHNLKEQFETEKEAREYLRENYKEIQTELSLFWRED